jgi:hypothetical protein
VGFKGWRRIPREWGVSKRIEESPVVRRESRAEEGRPENLVEDLPAEIGACAEDGVMDA